MSGEKIQRTIWMCFWENSNEGRSELVLEATTRTALRKDNWVYIPPYDGPAKNNNVNIELGNDNSDQLYNLESDLGQLENLAETNLDKLNELKALFAKIRGEGYDDVEKLELK